MYGERRQGNRLVLSPCRQVDRHRAEHNVADDSAIELRDQGHDGVAVAPQRLDQIGFVRAEVTIARERLLVDLTDRREVVIGLVSDNRESGQEPALRRLLDGCDVDRLEAGDVAPGAQLHVLDLRLLKQLLRLRRVPAGT